MKKQRFVSLLLIVALMLTVAACGGSDEEAADSAAPHVIKIGGQWSDASVHSRMVKEVFIPRVEELTEGRVTCEFYGNNSLGNEGDQVAQLQMGTLHVATLGEQSNSLDPGLMNILALPFVFDSEEHWDKIVGGEIGQELVANLPDLGVRVLGFTENGYREMTNNVRPINSVDDVKGLKLRVSSNELMIALWEALGVSCQAMSIGEVYSALETGAVDGQENPYNTIRTSNFHEVQKYIAHTHHVLNTMYFCASETWLQSLPEDIQGAVLQAADEACKWQHQELRALAATDLQYLLDAGMELTNPDIAGFREGTKSVYDYFYGKYPEAEEIVERIREAA